MTPQLEAPDRAEALAVAECIEYYLGVMPVGISRYTTSSSRQVYRVRMEDRDVILKTLGGKQVSSVSCIFAAEEMRAAGVPTPRVLASESGSKGGFGLLMGRPFVLTESVPGERLDKWLESAPPQEEIDAVFSDLGGVLCRVHSAASLRGFGKLDDRGVGGCSSWWEYLERHRISHPDGRLTGVLDFAELVGRGLLLDQRARNAAAMFTPDNPVFELTRASLLHNDITLRNVIIDPGESRVTGLIDLHNVIAGDPSFELARFEYFYADRAFLPALLEGYGQTPEKSRRIYLVYVLLEKIQWLVSRQHRFPGRLPRDLARLNNVIDSFF